ncbi:MAG: hypothetical protein ACP5FT_02895 [Acidilobus sp.]
MSPLKNQTRMRAKNVVDALRESGYRASTPREADGCLESYLECCGTVLVLAFFDGRYTDDVIVKVSPDVGGCEEILYSPRGLYVIGSDDKDIVQRILDKAKFIAAVSRPQTPRS